MRHDIGVERSQRAAFGSLEVLVGYSDFKVVKLLPLVDNKPFLTSLENYTRSNLWTEHHLRAVHVVIHHVLKSWLASFFVDYEKVNLFVSGDLDSNVSLDEINLTSHVWKSVIFSPESSLLINFEEKDGARGPDNESLLKQEVHGPHVIEWQLLKLALGRALSVDGEALPLPVESVDIVGDRTVKRLDREV